MEEWAKKIFENNNVTHGVFAPLFLMVFCLPAIVAGVPVDRIVKVFFYGTYVLICVYAGRASYRAWLSRNRLSIFLAVSILLIVVLSLLATIAAQAISHGRLFVVVSTSGFVVTLAFLSGVFLSLTRGSILRQIHEARLQQERKERELRLLRSQLSPHFVFNILNNLYGLSMSRADRLPDLLLRFSDLLRYSIYDSRNEFVSLDKELAYIENLIELERTRMGERLSLRAAIQHGTPLSATIPPMLLIGFIENAFKHGQSTSIEPVRIDVDVHVNEDTLSMTVGNSHSRHSVDDGSGKNSGVGMANTRRRLDLLYPGKYSITITDQDAYYKVHLTLKLI